MNTDKTTQGLPETRKFRVKRTLARIGATMAGCLITAGLFLWFREHPDTMVASAACWLVLMYGAWGLDFLIFNRRRK